MTSWNRTGLKGDYEEDYEKQSFEVTQRSVD